MGLILLGLVLRTAADDSEKLTQHERKLTESAGLSGCL